MGMQRHGEGNGLDPKVTYNEKVTTRSNHVWLSCQKVVKWVAKATEIVSLFWKLGIQGQRVGTFSFQ